MANQGSFAVRRRRRVVIGFAALAVVGVAVGVIVRVSGSSADPVVVSPQAGKGPSHEVLVPKRGSVDGYLAFLPPGYAHSSRPWPAIVYLHGAGERGDGSAPALATLASVSLPRLAATATLPAIARNFVVLAPQTDDDTWSPDQVHRWLSALRGRYRIDPNRLYLTGISMGGQGVFDYLNRYGNANEFAAMAPIAGNFIPLPIPDGLPSCKRMADTPLWAFHGEDDDVNSVQDSIAVIAYVDRVCHPPERLRLTVLLDTFHDSWDATYDLSAMRSGSVSTEWDAYRPDLYRWFLEHRRPDRR